MKTHEDVIDLIHDVLPRLPEDALELFDHLGLIGEQAELAEALATTVRALRGSAPPAPALSEGFTDTLMALIAKEAPPASVAAHGVSAETAAPRGSAETAPEGASAGEVPSSARSSGQPVSQLAGGAPHTGADPNSAPPAAERPASEQIPAGWALHAGGAEARRAPERERRGLALAAAGLLFSAGALLGSTFTAPVGSSAQPPGEQAVAAQGPPKPALEPKQDAPNQDAPEQDAPQQDAPLQDAPKQDAPQQDAPQQGAPQQDAPQQDAPQQDAPSETHLASTSEGGDVGEGESLPASLSAEDWQRDPLRAYMTEATYVLEALERLDASDPRVARALAIHLKSTGLVERGQHLINALNYSPSADDLRPLLNGTQLVLLKVRHAPRPDSAPLNAIRQEVRRTRLLAACRGLATQPISESPAGRDL